MPKEGQNMLKFTNHHKQMRVPYIIYADFETLNIPLEGCAGNPEEATHGRSQSRSHAATVM